MAGVGIMLSVTVYIQTSAFDSDHLFSTYLFTPILETKTRFLQAQTNSNVSAMYIFRPDMVMLVPIERPPALKRDSLDAKQCDVAKNCPQGRHASL